MEMGREEILQTIKENVHRIVPDATVMLFGSRARGDWHEESDWDILVLTEQVVTSELKHKVYDAVYPVTLEIFSFVNTIIANTYEWENHPGWYSLSISVKEDLVAI